MKALFDLVIAIVVGVIGFVGSIIGLVITPVILLGSLFSNISKESEKAMKEIVNSPEFKAKKLAELQAKEDVKLIKNTSGIMSFEQYQKDLKARELENS